MGGCLDQGKTTNQLAAMVVISYGPAKGRLIDNLRYRHVYARWGPKQASGADVVL